MVDTLGYFVNVNTGKLMFTSQDAEYPTHVAWPAYNVDGWSKINNFTYLVMRAVYGQGVVAGIEEQEQLA
jgi:hypothetical protein